MRTARPPLRTRVRTAIRRISGYDICKSNGFGRHALDDFRVLITSAGPTLFDVGANIGQTISELLYNFPSAKIHAFEPNPSTFQILQQRATLPNVKLNNLALSSQPGSQPLFQNEFCEMDSLLPLGPEGAGRIINQTTIRTSTVDAYCRENEIQQIDLLKTDAQGFDLEILKGSTQMLNDKRIALVYSEVIFTKMYGNCPGIDHIYRFLTDIGYELVSIYINPDEHTRRAIWADVLFARPT